jgi:hypothetical protein
LLFCGVGVLMDTDSSVFTGSRKGRRNFWWSTCSLRFRREEPVPSWPVGLHLEQEESI